MLIPLQQVLPFMKQSNPNSPIGGTKPAKEPGEHLAKFGLPALSKWNFVCAALNGVKADVVDSRALTVAPPEVRALCKAAGCPDWIETLITRIQRVPFNFLRASSHTNNKTLHRNILEGAYLEHEFYQDKLIPAVEEDFPQVSLLFHRLLKIVTAHPGLETFTFWPPIPKPSKKVEKVRVLDSRVYVDQRMEEDASSRIALLNKATIAFVRQISSRRCLGIPHYESAPSSDDEEAYHLHPLMEQMLSDLHAKGVALATDMATVSHNPELDEWPEITVPDRKELETYWEQQGINMDVATEEDIASFYQVHEVMEAKKERVDDKGKEQGDDSGEESEEELMDVDESEGESEGNAGNDKGLKRKNQREHSGGPTKKARVA